MIEEMNITCKNDILFKHLMLSDERLIHIILEGTTNHPSQQLTLLNPYLLPENYNGKSIIFDVAIQGENGHFYDIEMQNSPFYMYLFDRFHFYLAVMLVKQPHRGDPYSVLKACHQIIFIEDMGDGKQLVKKIIRKDQYGQPEPVTHGYTYYVYMPYINIIAEEKGVENLSLFEKVVYAIENDLNDDILELGEDVINCMNKNKLDFLSDEENFYLIASQMAAQVGENALRRDLDEVKQDLNVAKQDLNVAKQDLNVAKQAIAEKENTIENAIRNLMRKLNLSFEEATTFLGINKEALN